MKRIKKVQYSKLIVSTVVLLYFCLIPYSLVYIWRYEASAVLITILTTVGGVVAVVCNSYMNKSRFENVIKIQKALDKSSTSEIVSKVIQEAVKDEIKVTLMNKEITEENDKPKDVRNH